MANPCSVEKCKCLDFIEGQLISVACGTPGCGHDWSLHPEDGGGNRGNGDEHGDGDAIKTPKQG